LIGRAAEPAWRAVIEKTAGGMPANLLWPLDRAPCGQRFQRPSRRDRGSPASWARRRLTAFPEWHAQGCALRVFVMRRSI